MTNSADLSGQPAATASRRLPAFGWIMFDWAAQPFYTLVSTFLFAPYFATAFIGDPVRGQALWAYAAAVAGLAVAVLSPMLGAVADRTGGLRRWIFWFSAVFVAAQAALWIAAPGAGPETLWIVLLAVVVATMAGEFSAVFNNALMPAVVGPAGYGRLSGLGWAAGYVGGLIALVFMAGFIVTAPDTGKTLLGFDALIALDMAAREADRLVGPFSALWFVVFIIPFFLFTPDIPVKPGVRWRQAARDGLGDLAATLRNVREHGDIIRFLIARMLYTDGLSAIFIFGGIYAAATFGWGGFALGLFGIILSVAAAAGGFAGGFLDDRFGAKPVILGALALLIAGVVGVLSIDRESVLFGLAPAGAPVGVFGSVGEQLYLAFAVLIGVAAGPLQASSRSLLARMAPPDRITEFFGLFAFSGKATAFAAPLAIAAVTQATGSQRWGVAVTLLFLLAGGALMLGVKERRA
ncbi:MAG: MFS transporter [Hyphomicrobiales bacterium]|nr:MFS transporter [Hyphomicrobiales bacterium]